MSRHNQVSRLIDLPLTLPHKNKLGQVMPSKVCIVKQNPGKRLKSGWSMFVRYLECHNSKVITVVMSALVPILAMQTRAGLLLLKDSAQ